jgi:hypothetical protein
VLFQAPTPTSPTTGEVIPVYLDTGDISNIVFKWKHPTPAIEYELWLSEDEPFSQIVLQQTIKPESLKVPAWELPETVNLEKGQKYYWKVRVSQAATGERGDGNWSKVMSFSIASLPEEESSQPSSTPVPLSNDTEKDTEPLLWITNFPLWGWIVIAFLLVAIPVAAVFASRAKR